MQSGSMSEVMPHAQEDRPSQAGRRVDASAQLVLPVWGARHIDRFLDVVLPTLLSPGNIPAVAAGEGVVCRFMTREQDVHLFERAPGVKRLKEFATVDYCLIDDLMAPDVIPVTLTLTLHRGVAAGVKAGTPRSFLLINSDFALSDGSIKTAFAALANGGRLLLAPSLRVDEESVRPLLRAHQGPGGAITMDGRQMVRLALDHLHPTVLASRMDQSWLSCRQTHQMHWRLSHDTLVARGHCLFVLGVRTDEAPPPASAFCDYGMGPLMVGDGEPVVMGHSDDFLALEVAPHAYESALVAMGPPSLDAVAAKLQEWTTAFHRAQGDHLLVFTAQGPARFQPDPRPTAEILQRVREKLGQPLSPVGHPYWRGGVDGWRRSREEAGVAGLPAELAPIPPAPAAHPQAGARKLVRGWLVGFDKRGVWQPYHAIDAALRAIERRTLAAGRSLAAIGVTRMQSFEPLNRLRAPRGGAVDTLVVGVDLMNWSATLGFLRNAVDLSPSELVLLVTNTSGDAILPDDLVRLLAAVETRIDTGEVMSFDTRLDAGCEFAFGRLAGASPRDPLALAGRLMAALACPVRLVARNLLRGARTPADGSQPTAVILRCAFRA